MATDEERDDLFRAMRQQEAEFDQVCREFNLSPEEQRALKLDMEMDWLVVEQKAQRICELLDSERRADRELAILELIRQAREDSLAMVKLLDARLRRLEDVTTKGGAITL